LIGASGFARVDEEMETSTGSALVSGLEIGERKG